MHAQTMDTCIYQLHFPDDNAPGYEATNVVGYQSLNNVKVMYIHIMSVMMLFR